MEHAISILMLCFSGAILIYAAKLWISKDVRLIVRHYAAKVDNPRKYAEQFAKIMALVALSPALAAVVGFFAPTWVMLVVLLVSMIGVLCLSPRIINKANDPEPGDIPDIKLEIKEPKIGETEEDKECLSDGRNKRT